MNQQGETLNTQPPNQTEMNLKQEEDEESRPQVTLQELNFWRQYRNIRRKYVSRQIRNFIEYYIAAICCVSLFFMVSILFGGPKTSYPFIISINCWTVFYLTRFVRYIKMYPTILEPKKALHIRKCIVQIVAFFMSLSSMSIFARYGKPGVWFITIPLIISYITNFTWHITSANSCYYFLKCVKYTFSLFRIFFVFMIFAKLDHLFTANWAAVLWPVWFLMVGLAMLILFMITLLIFTCQQLSEGKSSSEEFYGLAWIFYLLTGAFCLTIYIYFAVSKLTSKYDNHEYDYKKDMNIQFYIKVCLPLIAYLALALGTFSMVQKSLPTWFEYFLFYEEIIIENEVLKHEEELTKPPEIATKSFETPRYLKQLASTYFRKSTMQEFLNYKSSQKPEIFRFSRMFHKRSASGNFSRDQRSFLQGAFQVKNMQEYSLRRLNSLDPRLSGGVQTDRRIGHLGVLGSDLSRPSASIVSARYPPPTWLLPKVGSISKDVEVLPIDTPHQFSLSDSIVSAAPNECLICFSNAPNAVMLSCGHGGLCYDCGICILQDSKVCHFCRQEIVGILRLVGDANVETIGPFVKAEAISYILKKKKELDINQLFEKLVGPESDAGKGKEKLPQLSDRIKEEESKEDISMQDEMLKSARIKHRVVQSMPFPPIRDVEISSMSSQDRNINISKLPIPEEEEEEGY